MIEEVQKYLEKSHNALEVAQELCKKGYLLDGISKNYYAMFYAAQALLISGDIRVSKHSAVVAKIGQHFAKTGKISPEYHRYLIEAKALREQADYDIFFTISSEAVTEKLEEARAFIQAAENLLTEKE